MECIKESLCRGAGPDLAAWVLAAWVFAACLALGGCGGGVVEYRTGRPVESGAGAAADSAISESGPGPEPAGQASDSGEGQPSLWIEEAVPPDEASVFVHVCGSVARPGVVELPAGSRGFQAVEAAGGLLEEADAAYANLAAVLEDGQQLYIPSREEAAALGPPAGHARAGGEGRTGGEDAPVNINTADAALLQTLPGIGPGRAQDILDYRQSQGPFAAIEDLQKVKGIKGATYAKLESRICVR